MTPKELSAALVSIAEKLEASRNPSRSAVSADISKIIRKLSAEEMKRKTHLYQCTDCRKAKDKEHPHTDVVVWSVGAASTAKCPICSSNMKKVKDITSASELSHLFSDEMKGNAPKMMGENQ